MSTGTTKYRGEARRSSLNEAAETAFLPGETGKELDAGRMNAASELAAAEAKRLGRKLTFQERWDAVMPAYRD